jgi:hypothetical protein
MKTVRKKLVMDDRSGESEEEDEKEEWEAKRGEWKSKLKKSERQREENGKVNWSNELLQNFLEISVRTDSYALNRQANAATKKHAVCSSENLSTILKGKAGPLQAWSGPEGSRKLRFPDFMTTAQDGGKVVSLHTDRLYSQEMSLLLISVRDCVDPRAIVRSEVLCHWKIPMTPRRIEPETFRFVAQYLKQSATATPRLLLIRTHNIENISTEIYSATRTTKPFIS